MIVHHILLSCFFIASITFDAISDALIDNDKKRRHLQEVLTIGFILLTLFPFSNIVMHFQDLYGSLGVCSICFIYILKYAVLRAGIFNIVYNSKRIPKLSWSYLGTTSVYDRLLSKLNKTFLAVYYVVCIFVGIIL